jgi:hypothetical protein
MHSSDPTDLILLQRIVARDTAALADLYDRHCRLLFGLILRRHTGPEECYVIRGSLVVEGQLLRAGDFHHAEGASDHDALHTDEGVEVLLVAAASDYLPALMRPECL